MRLDGFGLFVDDMANMIRFYRDVLGFEIKEGEDTSNVYLIKDDTLFLLYGRKDFEKMTSRKYEYIKGLNGHTEIALYVDTFEEVDAAYENANFKDKEQCELLLSGSAIVNIPVGLIVFAYILGLGKFFALISAMDTGSSFEGMGASREACFTSIVEPAFFMVIGSIMALTGNYTFDALGKILSSAGTYGILIIVFTALVLFIMLLTEGSRVPVDDPATHLELTMIHEVMILDNSGVDLALMTWASGMKMVILKFAIYITTFK